LRLGLPQRYHQSAQYNKAGEPDRALCCRRDPQVGEIGIHKLIPERTASWLVCVSTVVKGRQSGFFLVGTQLLSIPLIIGGQLGDKMA
jgi:hypothetical protein